ncbi:LysR family transcriptional regulator [Candidatus Odyssella thessalonicensis]|uniref:LysR family transcriptional regulator n=1 Tax=Candidatus Odyssella thessalonicensis TaxID=84647 RepID=UPI000225B787|nr:LysR family transcriptional regulator [Candidatus Odyssella thessalonicensis]
MDRDKLLAFYYTVTLGSISNAADKLGVQPPAISKLLKSLEKGVGHRLLVKKGRKLALNDKGKVFFETTQIILKQYELSLQRLARYSDQTKVEFTLAIHPCISSYWFTKAITPFLEAHPDVSFTIKTLKNVPDFQAGEADIDIRNISSRSLEEERLMGLYLTTYDFRLYASQSYIDKRGSPQSIDDLEEHTLVSFNQDSIFPYTCRLRSLKNQHRFISECPLSIAHAVEDGLGIGPLLVNVAELSSHSLIPVLHDQLSQSLDIFYTYPQALENSTIVRELYDYLRALSNHSLNGRIK